MSNTLRVEALFMQAGISILGVETEACSPQVPSLRGLLPISWPASPERN